MQFEFRIDDDNYIRFDLQLQGAGVSGYTDGPELLAATVSDKGVSKLSESEIVGIASQIVDYCSRDQSGGKAPSDWFEDEWLPATRQSD